MVNVTIVLVNSVSFHSKNVIVPSFSRLCFTMLRARQFARQAVPCGRRAFTSGKTMRAGVKYENMTIGIVKETLPLERRVAQSPESVGKLVKEGFKVPCPRGGA